MKNLENVGICTLYIIKCLYMCVCVWGGVYENIPYTRIAAIMYTYVLSDDVTSTSRTRIEFYNMLK